MQTDIFVRSHASSSRRFAGLALLLLSLFVAGCDDPEPALPGGLSYDGPPVIAGPLLRNLDESLRFHVFGLGEDGPDRSLEVAGVKVAFRLVASPDGGERASLSRGEAVTDAGGVATVAFMVGDKPGIYRVEASLPDYPGIPPVGVIVLGGVRIAGGGQDGWVGRAIERRLTVHMESAPGVPVPAGAGLVRFDLLHAPEGSDLSSKLVRTDPHGEAGVEVRLGGRQGKIDVGIAVLDGVPGRVSMLEPIQTAFFAIDGWSVAVSMLGGLALFLFGMRMMSESLQFVAGDKLRDLLNMLTRNRVLAVGAGATVTALIQSSSACTVMVVGFVNAGLMRLEQAIGVIMGANIGTTLTAQIIALKLSEVALPAIIVGVAVLFFAKRQSVKSWASIVVGFGILFLGMNVMSRELGELRESASLVNLFKGLHCVPGADGVVPFGQFMKAVGVGLVVTLVLQSSAATIGLLITVSTAGLIDPYAAFGILLGDNVGTTITAVLAAIGTSATAKRAACFHVMFNVCGVILMVALNYVQWPTGSGRPIFMEFANMFTAGDVFRAGENLPRFIANAHSFFNVTCTLLFLPFVLPFARLCRFLVKDDPGDLLVDDARRILEPHLLATPSLALQQVWTEVGVMLEKARAAQSEGYKALAAAPGQDWSRFARRAKDLEKETDELKAAVTEYLGGISLTMLNEAQSEMFPHLVRTVNDAERVADLGKHLSRLAKRVNKRSLKLTDEARADLDGMMGLVDGMLELAEKTVTANADGIEMSGGGAVLRKKLLEDGKRLDKEARAMATTLRKNHERRHEAGLCDIRSGVVFLDVGNSLARSAGCALNIIEAACHSVSPYRPNMSLRLSARSRRPEPPAAE